MSSAREATDSLRVEAAEALQQVSEVLEKGCQVATVSGIEDTCKKLEEMAREAREESWRFAHQGSSFGGTTSARRCQGSMKESRAWKR